MVSIYDRSFNMMGVEGFHRGAAHAISGESERWLLIFFSEQAENVNASQWGPKNLKVTLGPDDNMYGYL